MEEIWLICQHFHSYFHHMIFRLVPDNTIHMLTVIEHGIDCARILAAITGGVASGS